MKKHPPLIVVDCETLGLGDAPIWEVAWIKVRPTGSIEGEYTAFVDHDPSGMDSGLPQSFIDDYEKRYDRKTSELPEDVIRSIAEVCKDRPLVLGSNPAFDMSRLEGLAKRYEVNLGWHYHPEDVPTLARGWLNGRGVYPAPPWKSDLISQMIGIDPRDYPRHTALGDVRWTLAMWRKVMER